VLHQEERAVHVDAEHLARIGEKSTLRMSVAFVARDAGVVHHDVQRAGRRVDGGAHEVANDGFTDIPMAPLVTRATFPSNLSFDRKERG